MPIPEDMVRVRLVFDLGPNTADLEQAIMGFHMKRKHGTGNPTDWPADIQQIAEKVLAKWKTRVLGTAMWSGEIVLNRVEAYHLNSADGKTIEKGMAAAVGANAWRGTATNPSLPFQCATVVSLYGYTPGTFVRDAKYQRGRFYLPPVSSTLMGGGDRVGAIQQVYQQSLSDNITAWLNDVQGLEVGPSVAGGGDSMSLHILSKSSNASHQVNAIRVGAAVDTQRRRKRSVPERYIDSVLTHS